MEKGKKETQAKKLLKVFQNYSRRLKACYGLAQAHRNICGL